mmetsp:Transcript_15314/g.50305  ORF Transcript_15314/g.50305 Transcript_15314/m.50305 type:complete len:177 (-) Transcript_15314:947-1477(-)
MGEVHVVGQLVGASGFEPDRNLFCKWAVEAGRQWDLLEGIDRGQTHVDHPEDGELAVWSHPLDLHFACKALNGWPKMHFQVWSQDEYGRHDICGYGFCHVPTTPGMHETDCVTWIPEGSTMERMSEFFLGGRPRLRVEETVFTPGDRYRLQTRSAGVIHLQLGVVVKDMSRFNIKL